MASPILSGNTPLLPADPIVTVGIRKRLSLGFKPKNGKYEEGVTFDQIVELYLFNANFRQMTFAEIEKIEVNVRCRIANYFAEVYGVLGYMEPRNFVNVSTQT